MFLPCYLPCLPCCLPYHFLCERPNVQDKIDSMQVYLTDEHIEYQEGPYFTCLRHDCFGKQGKVHQSVPYDRVQDVRIQEPAGNYCCFFPFRISLVSVQTASFTTTHTTWLPGKNFRWGMFGKAELELWGLEDPKRFRQKTLEMKKLGKGAPRQELEGAPEQAGMGPTFRGG